MVVDRPGRRARHRRPGCPGRHRSLDSRRQLTHQMAPSTDLAACRADPDTLGALASRSLQSWRPVRGRLACRRPSRLRWFGQAWFEHPGLPASRSCCTPVSVRPAVSGMGGDGADRFTVVRCRSADPRWLSNLWPFDWSACLLCCLGTCPGGAPWHARGAGLWEGRCTTSWLFCWLLCDVIIFEKT
jgi:hypothetical protein